MPLRQLAGFKRETLKAGKTKTIKIPVAAQLLRRWEESENRYVVDPCAYRIAAETSSD